jgi:hypothetical protein
MLLGVGWLVYIGKLVPGRTVDRLTKTAEANAELWQKVAEREADRSDLAVAQMDKLLTGMATHEALLRALSPPSQPGRGRR